MAKNLKSYGEVMDVTLTGSVTSGDVMIVGALAAIALSTGDSGDTIAASIEGVFEVAKLSTDDVGQGDQLYWDSGNSQATLSDGTGANPALGKAFVAAGNGETTVQAKLNA